MSCQNSVFLQHQNVTSPYEPHALSVTTVMYWQASHQHTFKTTYESLHAPLSQAPPPSSIPPLPLQYTPKACILEGNFHHRNRKHPQSHTHKELRPFLQQPTNPTMPQAQILAYAVAIPICVVFIAFFVYWLFIWHTVTKKPPNGEV